MAQIKNEVAARDAKPPTITSMLNDLKPELQRALPKGMDADRLARIALTVLRKDPKLAKCDPYSFAGALMTSAQLGLEPGVNEEAYLVPYGKECQLIIGYQGFAKLFWQHPLAKHIDAQAVYERDEFDYAYGLDPFLTHKPARGDRGEITDYYAVASLSTGARVFTVLTAEEVKKLRGGKVGSSGNIPDPMHWMERKTALRQLVKLLPKSATLASAVDADEQPGSQLRAIAAPSPALEAAPAGVDPETGQIIEGEYDPTTEPGWEDTTQDKP